MLISEITFHLLLYIRIQMYISYYDYVHNDYTLQHIFGI